MTSISAARFAYAGTPEFAVPGLQALLSAGASVACVLTQPDRPSGRGRRLTGSPVRQLADRAGLPVWQPVRFNAEAAAQLPATRPDVLVVVAYGLILPRWMLDWPHIATINVHASLLPRWRGASPIQQAVLTGDAETGVSIMQLEQGLDTGPVYGRRATPIGANESAGELHDRLAVLGAELLLELLPGILERSLEPEPQRNDNASYAPKITKSDGLLDWQLPAVTLARQVRAYNPWPVAEARTIDGERLRVWGAEALAEPVSVEPGVVVAATTAGLDVATGDGVLRLSVVQPPGGRTMDAGAWLSGHDVSGLRFVRAE